MKKATDKSTEFKDQIEAYEQKIMAIYNGEKVDEEMGEGGGMLNSRL